MRPHMRGGQRFTEEEFCMAMYNSAHRINQPNADDTWRTQTRINAPTKRDEIVAEQWLEDSFDSTCARQKKELGKCASARQPRKLATKLVARTSTMTSTSPTSHKSNNTTKCEKINRMYHSDICSQRKTLWYRTPQNSIHRKALRSRYLMHPPASSPQCAKHLPQPNDLHDTQTQRTELECATR
jgi:hypothetical protein